MHGVLRGGLVLAFAVLILAANLGASAAGPKAQSASAEIAYISPTSEGYGDLIVRRLDGSGTTARALLSSAEFFNCSKNGVGVGDPSRRRHFN